jgi:hypothetical protein
MDFQKCGDKDAPVTTFVANTFLTLDTAVLGGPQRSQK